jgi:hypothetical protein
MVFPACGEKQGEEEEEEAAHDDDDDDADDDAPLVSHPLLSHGVPLCLASLLLLLSLQPHFLPLHPPPSPAAAVAVDAGGACCPSLWFPHVLASQTH